MYGKSTMHGQVLDENFKEIFQIPLNLSKMATYRVGKLSIERIVSRINWWVRPLIISLFAFAMAAGARAQSPQAWIDFSQSYYKVTLAQDGLYRLTYTDLQAAGFPVSTVDPRTLQLFHRGVEQAITVQGQEDAQFNPGDFIEFFGRRNDGTRDAALYKPSALQPHPYQNLYSDSSAYFLTWKLATLGKRISTFSEVNVGLPLETSHTNEVRLVNANEYSTGNTVSLYLQYTHFDQGEGWTGQTICSGNAGCTGQLDYVLENLTQGVVPAGLPQFSLMVVGRDAIPHQAEIWVGPNSGALRLLTTQSFFNFQTALVQAPLAWTDIGADGRLTVRVRAINTPRDRLSVSYMQVQHPQNFNLQNQNNRLLQLAVRAVGKAYVELQNALPGSRLFDITDPSDVVRVGTQSGGGLLTAVVPNTSSSRKILVTNSFATPRVRAVRFRPITAAAHNYLIISHPSLMKPGGSYADPVRAFAAYRASPAGGDYDTLVVTTPLLYDQFNYGETSSVAIYEFMKFMVEQGNPRYLFLIGKGLDVSTGFHRGRVTTYSDLVPSAGIPGSDGAFTAGLGSAGAFEPAVPTGRITASTPADVSAYLNKVKEIESQPVTEPWRKELLHLSGGIQPNEIVAFRQFLDGFKQTAEGLWLGGRVTTIAKRDPSPVEVINISDKVNEGVNLITFFGHSSPGTIDIDIGFVSDPVLGYNNVGRYPAFLVNGCNAGAFFSDSEAFGEDWILTANKGARAFIAHSAYGYVAALQQYSNFFYNIGFADQNFLTRGIGDVQREVSRQFLTQSSQDIQAVTQVQQMVLLGDPALRLFGTALPDYEVSNTGVGLQSLDGNPVTALSNTFGVRFIVRNRGAAIGGTLPVRLTRQLPNNAVLTYDSLFAGVSFRDTLVFTLPREAQGFGNNRFTILLDPDQQLAELEENNNTAVFEALIPLSSTRNLLPAPYGIATQPLVEFVFQNANTAAQPRAYRWELDTVATFDSPYKKQLIIQGSPLVTHTFGVQTTDSVVYYWRTRFDQPLPTESADWAVSSFTFISNGAPGWAQLEFDQLGENATVGLVQDPAIKGLRFEESTASVFVRTFGSGFPSPPTDVSFKVNGSEYNLSTQGQPCRNNTINLVAFNKSALVPYAPVPLNFQDPRTCGREPQVINSFLSTERETGVDDLFQAITNTAFSDSVILFSIGDAAYSTWTTALKFKLQEVGVAAGQLSSLVDGEPVVILGRKGAPAGTARLFRAAAPATAGEVLVSEELTGRVTTGAMTSVLVGPAAAWQEFIPFVEDREAFDQVDFSISVVSLAGNEFPLLNGVTSRRDLSFLQAADYPYVRVTYQATDEINLTPAQVRWMVTYTPVPEGVLLPGRHSATSPQSVAEGQTVAFDYRFVNVSTYTFPDSLTVNAGLRNPAAVANPGKTFKIKPPAPRDTSSFSVSWSTIGQAGENDVWAWVNNRVLPELAYDNNIVDRQRFLIVARDGLPPVLDVTFDGRYLRNGDLVSASPTVLMTLIDENPFLLKQDTTGFQMWLSSPCATGVCVRQIYFSQPGVSWQAATASSPFRVSLQPVLMPGTYTLRVVARDASGNASGTDPYEITFWVEEGSAFELKSVSPNPSATDVVFEFLLKGQDVPDEFSLEIFAPDGRKVHNFGDGDVADFFIGTNRLVWQTGGLAAGVYLFRMSFRVAGNPTVTTGRVVKL